MDNLCLSMLKTIAEQESSSNTNTESARGLYILNENVLKMKKKQYKLVTDYQFENNLESKWVEVELLDYDGYKYLTIQYEVNGQYKLYAVKVGYVYKEYKDGRRVSLTYKDLYPLEKTKDNLFLTKKAIAAKIKDRRKNKRSYSIETNDEYARHTYHKLKLKSLKDVKIHLNKFLNNEKINEIIVSTEQHYKYFIDDFIILDIYKNGYSTSSDRIDRIFKDIMPSISKFINRP